jgi:site-specific DNA recombinase
VTQQFNTTSSMGRLTLNVLLSFAQFEREVTGERIRDKVAASKKKGMWMGGNIPLGYDLKDRSLVINEEEAATVREIFSIYLRLGSVFDLREELARRGIRSKYRVCSTGREVGGKDFSRGTLYHLLSSTLYIGKVSHGDKVYDGLHEAIIDPHTRKATA